jgi:hypothetical protein
LWGGFSAAAALAGALHHPLAPPLAVLLLGTVMAWAMWRPDDLWFMLPALLPVASFTPWTGWWLVDESDLLILAAMGGAYLRWGRDVWSEPAAVFRRTPRSMQWVYVVLPPVLLTGVWRGLDDARGATPWAAMLADLWAQGVYGDYDLPGNTLRVAKSMVWGLVLMPVLYRYGHAAPLRLARGMVFGLFWVCTAVVWERGIYAAPLDFSDQTRITAWFWEMHVGGGAIDVYLALALPFAWWAAWTAPHGWRWCAAGALMLLSIYAVLMTYSRGVYLSVALALIALGMLAHKYRMVAPDSSVWHRRAMAYLVVALVAETLGVLVGGTFMSDRLGRANKDLYHRVEHWQRGVDLLKTPSQWLLGLGVGRLPAHYSTQTPEGALPGQVRWVRSAEGGTQAWLSGPAQPGVKGELALTQRVALAPGGAYRVRLRGAVQAPARLSVQLCEQHLLYAFECQAQTALVLASSDVAGGWTELQLHGPDFASAGIPSAWRAGVLSIAVLGAKGPVRLDTVELIDPQGLQILKNPTFVQGPRYWGHIAHANFLPWHMDNLYLELLIERGLLGLAVLAALAVGALVMLAQGVAHQKPLALIVGISIAATLLIGVVISVIEIPRVSTMLWLLLVVSPLVRED